MALIMPKRSLCYVIAIFAVIFTVVLFQSHGKNIDWKSLTKCEPPGWQPFDYFKPTPGPEAAEPIVDAFPYMADARTHSDAPPVPSYNKPPTPHVSEYTPLFIGFTRNWPLLQQVVVSYIAAGWPPEDIHVIDNTGTMNSNRIGKLTLQNPFYLNYDRLTKVLGVKVVTAPTLLTFAQLQNFYTNYALEQGWKYYFWGHMDIAALSDEEYVDPTTGKYKSLYMRVVDVMRETIAPDYHHKRWALRFYHYDNLALVNVAAYMDVGGWDTMIPFYATDCDMHERLRMADYAMETADPGLFYDADQSVDNLMHFFHQDPNAKVGDMLKAQDQLKSDRFFKMKTRLIEMEKLKNTPREGGRNRWQMRQSGGKGEPIYRDPDGFASAIEMTIAFGKEVYAEKWGHRGCGLKGAGKVPEKAWHYGGAPPPK